MKDETWSSKRSGKRISSELKDRDSFTTEELKPFLTLPGEEISPVTIRTRLNALKRCGIITHIGRSLYTLKKLYDYTPEIDQTLRKVYLELRKRLPLTRICVWRPFWLNEFALHIAFMQTIVVESERETERAVFEVLQESLEKNSSLTGTLLLLNPSAEDVDLYVSGQSPAIVVGRLITEAPVRESDGVIVPRLEKMLVDLFSGGPVLEPFGGAEMDRVFRNAFNTYALNVNTIIRYATRRGKRQEMADYLTSKKLTGYREVLDDLR
ncbi:hypothetical protein V512_014455 [Mesotoga sp. Brook.08.105.5.1]|uniref:DUF6577 family protein n=1 Tax=Mesotoga sp. Brook.08.105.5.1 TaxID=1421002 RepID=UPI000C1776D9|nr:DUF6577 family protein [Mesotoga sp. Brook.08.105.5.1]PVD18071.1 hypothetical protein V512_014455 [Mesotoga sp. Brook.08.105.5.1]RAM59167.1 hypothetical protein DS65_01120 [Mesotoga sp. SC_4PWL113PWK15]